MQYRMKPLRPLDWLIIGGGIHGTYLSQVLVRRLGFDRDGVRVLDEAAEPLAAWHRHTRACGMTYMRSPQVHHLGLRSDSLRRHARQNGRPDAFIEPYRRPALSLFDDHAHHVIEQGKLAELRIQGRANCIQPTAGGYRVEADGGAFHARRVLLAPGQPPLYRPPWGSGLRHVFAPDFSLAAQGAGRIAVVGGGATGGQLALALADRGAEVALVSRHRPRRANFDSHPCYLGTRCLAGFARSGIAQRRRIIASARNPGTVPREVHAGVAAHAAVRLWQGEVSNCTDDGVQFSDGRRLRADRIILATGFAGRPGGELVRRAIADLDLPVGADGWPVLSADLQWRPGLCACGRLAELELGPAAGNIAGARMAGRRLGQPHRA
jgi:glycine/D-amino acid oxidase-like deaminating enzyme